MCSMCNDSGQIVATHKEKKYLYGFRCPCPIAERRKLMAMPLWEEKYRNAYEVDFKPFFARLVPGYKQVKANLSDE